MPDLTPTERRVAELVADGKSNREVAAALGIGPKTVETHLGRVFRKLGIRSRAELTSLRPSGPLRKTSHTAIDQDEDRLQRGEGST